ncbi:MAG: hypothetical protein ACK4PK_08965 [Alphaproteobacteria bacterium]
MLSGRLCLYDCFNLWRLDGAKEGFEDGKVKRLMAQGKTEVAGKRVFRLVARRENRPFFRIIAFMFLADGGASMRQGDFKVISVDERGIARQRHIRLWKRPAVKNVFYL